MFLNRTRHVPNLRRHQCSTARTYKHDPDSMNFANILLTRETTTMKEKCDSNLETVEQKIKSGIYAISSKRKDKSVVWQIFGNVVANDGSMIQNLIGCRKCYYVCKLQRNKKNIHMHRCVLNSMPKKTNETATDENIDDYEDNIPLKKLIKSKDKPTANPKSTDCDDDDDNADDTENINDDNNVCNESALDYDFDDYNVVQDNLYPTEEDEKSFVNHKDPITIRTVSNKESNQFKIFRGQYDIIDWKAKANNAVFENFKRLKDKNGRILPTVIICVQCNDLVQYREGKLTNLKTHKCCKTAVTIKNVNLSKDTINICLKWIIDNGYKCTAVDNMDFRKKLINFMRINGDQNTDYNYAIPKASFLTNQLNGIVRKCNKAILADIQRALKNGCSISVNICGNTSTVKQYYLDVSFYYIAKNKINTIYLGNVLLVSKTLNSSEVHNKFIDLLKKFNINNLMDVMFVTNVNESTINSALKKYKRINCSRDLMNVNLNDAIAKSTLLNSFIASCKELLTFLIEQNIETNNCILSGGVSWSKLLNTFKILDNNWTNIKENLNLNSASFHKKLIKELLQLFKHFEDVLTKMENTQQAVGLHYVYASITFIRNICKSNADDSPQLRQLKENLLNVIKDNWIPNFDIVHQVALFLFPPTNKLNIFDRQTINNIHNFCKNKITKYSSNKTVSAKENSDVLDEHLQLTEPESDYTENSSPEQQMLVDDSESISSHPVHLEITEYGNCSVTFSMDFDVLEWWENQKNDFPHLYQLSRCILCIPASVPVTPSSMINDSYLISDEYWLFRNTQVYNKFY